MYVHPSPIRSLAAAAVVLCAVAFIAVPHAHAADEPRRVVVAIGHNHGLSTEAPLRHAESDAERFAAVFREIGGVRSSDVRVLVHPEPGEVLETLGWATRRARQKTDSVVVYYSGHGDAQSLHLGGEKLSIESIEQVLQLGTAPLSIVVLDACRSEDGRAKGLQRGDAFSISLERPLGPSGLVMLRSASDGEAAQESDELRGGVFTHYFLVGLRGAADHDDDGRVSLAESYAYAFGRTLQRSGTQPGALQRPSADIDIEGAGPIVLTRPQRAASTLVIPSERDAQYIVYRLPAASVEAEIWADPAQSQSLALPEGRFLVHRRTEDEVRVTELALPYGGRAELSPSRMTPAPKATLASRGAVSLVRRHELGAQYGVGGATAAGLGHRIRAAYGYRITSAWSFVAGLEFGLSDYETSANDAEEMWYGGEVRVDWRWTMGPVEGRLGVGAAAHALNQTLRASTSEALANVGQPDTTRSTVLAAGPTAALGVRIPLSSQWAIQTGASTQVWLLNQDGELQPRLLGSADLGFVVEF